MKSEAVVVADEAHEVVALAVMALAGEAEVGNEPSEGRSPMASCSSLLSERPSTATS